MKNLYRYRVEHFHWLFTDRIKSAATVRYRLRYELDQRRFLATVQRRSDHFAAWQQPYLAPDSLTEQLRALLPPPELAACAAASITPTRRTPDA